MPRPTLRRSEPHSTRTALTLEPLEAREVPAVAAPTSVPVDANGLAWVAPRPNPVYAPQGIVSIYAVTGNNRYTIRQVGNPGYIQLDAIVNGLLTSIQYRNVHEVRFHGSGGNDFFENLTTTRCVAYGNSGDDVLIGGQSGDVIDGGAGADAVYGRGGDDRLFGGSGVDTLYGGFGNDALAGGFSPSAGDGSRDRLYGEEGADRFLAEYVYGGLGTPWVNIDAPLDFNGWQGDAVVNWI